ncbi:SPW_0924 family protein [Streptomyces sp. NPDC006430]
MRAFVAAALGLAAALALVFAITAFGVPEGKTSPKPLLTTAPAAPGQD